VDVSGYSLWTCGDSLFYDEVEFKAAWGMMSPAVVMDLPSEVVPLPVVDCFFRAIAHWRIFEDAFGRREI